MALALSDLQRDLSVLVTELGVDPDIQQDIRQIGTTVRKCVSIYNKMMNTEGHIVLIQKVILATAEYPMDIEVVKLTSALEAIIDKLKFIRAEVIAMETGVHSKVEVCRSRKVQHRTEIINKRRIVKVLKEDMHIAEDELLDCEHDLTNLEQSVSELEKRANDIEKTAGKKNCGGIVNAILGGVGLILAPFTGGLSLALAASGGIGAGVNFNSEHDCRKTAEQLRSDAGNKRKTANDFRARKTTLVSQNSTIEAEVHDVCARIDNLRVAAHSLEDTTNGMLTFIGVIDSVLQTFQSMDTCFKKALLETNSFKIIQNAFCRNPERLEERAHAHLEQLKVSWDAVEEILVNHGVGYGGESSNRSRHEVLA